MQSLGKTGYSFNMNGLMPTGRRSKSLMLIRCDRGLFICASGCARSAPASPPVAKPQPAAPGAPFARQSRPQPARAAAAQAAPAAAAAASAGRVGPGQRAGPASITSSRSAATGSNPADYDPAGPRRRDPGRRSAGRCPPPRPSASTGSRPTSRSATCSKAGADRLVHGRQRSRRREAGRACCAARLRTHSIAAALNGLLPTHPQYAALKAALEMTPGDARPPSATASGSTWTAGAGCRASSATNISSSTCPASTRPWSRTASTAGSSGRSPARPRRRRRSFRRWRSA